MHLEVEEEGLDNENIRNMQKLFYAFYVELVTCRIS